MRRSHRARFGLAAVTGSYVSSTIGGAPPHHPPPAATTGPGGAMKRTPSH